METQFWHNKWQNRELGFHNEHPHPLLVEHVKQLNLAPNSRIFVPLCGKSIDIVWLADQGHKVIGAELSVIAVAEFFEALGQTPKLETCGELQKYSAGSITIFQGDIFKLKAEQLGAIDVVYDRAAFIALPDTMRQSYSTHLIELTRHAKQLLISIEYDQTQMDGPPFSLPKTKIEDHYQNLFNIQKLDEMPYPGGIRGEVEGLEVVWLLETA